MVTPQVAGQWTAAAECPDDEYQEEMDNRPILQLVMHQKNVNGIPSAVGIIRQIHKVRKPVVCNLEQTDPDSTDTPSAVLEYKVPLGLVAKKGQVQMPHMEQHEARTALLAKRFTVQIGRKEPSKG